MSNESCRTFDFKFLILNCKNLISSCFQRLKYCNNKTKWEQTYVLKQDERIQLQQELETLYKQRVLLQQSLREQQNIAAAASEALFLELLEVGDALEALLEYLANNPNPNPEFFQRLPRSLGAVQRKFLSVLGKRQLCPIELEGTQPDFYLCRVVDREVRPDLAEQTITKVVRRGFLLGEKILRPVEVITSKLN